MVERIQTRGCSCAAQLFLAIGLVAVSSSCSSSSAPDVIPKAPATEVYWNGAGLQDSAWLGGPGESWERGPYYVDGLLPLAYLLDDEALITKAQKWVDWTLEHQRDDGSIGAIANLDWWPNMVMLKALTQYQEVTGDPRVIPVMTKYFEHHLQEAAERPLTSWARMRWSGEALSIIWLYNRTGDAKLLGDPAFGDRLERITYNALPATFKPDMWAHQYFQQANQVECSVDESRNWTSSWADANLFGLEPAYGCCTANTHQGWPKFVSHMWMATRDEGLALVA